MGNESTEISESSLHTISDFEIKLEVEDQSPISILQDIEAIIDQRNNKSNAPKAIKSFCVICQEGFSSKRHLKKHVMEVHKEQYLKELYKHTCDICQTQFKHQKELINHFEEIHKDQKPFACGECNFRTKSIVSLRAHKDEHSDKNFHCEFCDYVHKNKRKLYTHTTYKHPQKSHSEKMHTENENIKPYACGKCEFRTKSKAYLKGHIDGHSENIYSCEYCDYVHNNRQVLRTHISNKHPKQMYSCDLCDYKCGNKINMENHRNGKHGDRKYYCSMCEYQTTWKHWIKSHEKAKHVDKSIHVCVVCDYSSPIQKSFTFHKCQLEGVLKCDVCNFRTLSSEELGKHSADNHADIIICDACGYKTDKSEILEIHKSNNHSPKGYKCPTCDYEARSMFMLKHHKRNVHRKLVCKKCSQEFSNSYYLTNHYKSEHGTGFCCANCDFKGKSNHLLKIHMLREHVSVDGNK
jgi:KRAB domain-containing zinc finger protein